MQTHCSLVVAGALSCASLFAQAYVYSPEGANFSPVLRGRSRVMFSGSGSHYQQVDASVIGSPVLTQVSAIAFRRALGFLGSSNGSGQSVGVEVRMAHGDFATFSSTFAANYADAPVVTFPLGQINLPDWRPTIAYDRPDHGYDAEIPFQQPWTYDGQRPLLWDVRVPPQTISSDYWQDWNSSAPTSRGYGQNHSYSQDGCQTSTGAFSLYPFSYSTSNRLYVEFSCKGGPPNSSATLLIGLTDPNLTVPGLCAPLHTDAIIGLRRTTNPLGEFASNFWVPWQAQYGGALITLQIAALDPSRAGFPVALSDGVLTSAPPLATPSPIRTKQTWTVSWGSPVGGAVEEKGLSVRYRN